MVDEQFSGTSALASGYIHQCSLFWLTLRRPCSTTKTLSKKNNSPSLILISGGPRVFKKSVSHVPHTISFYQKNAVSYFYRTPVIQKQQNATRSVMRISETTIIIVNSRLSESNNFYNRLTFLLILSRIIYLIGPCNTIGNNRTGRILNTT